METLDPWDGGDGDELEAEIMRADSPFGADRQGTTSVEALAGQRLAEALAREQREARLTDEVLELVDDGAVDAEDQLVAEGSLVNDDFASPEESAMSIRQEAPGATDHEDEH